MMKVRELIKRVRGCRTSEEERNIINKECAEMRNMKEQNDQTKIRNLSKCIFIHMLGFETSFIEMTCVNLLSSSNFTEKRIAYVALCVLMDEKRDVLLLTTSTIKKDLESNNQYIVAVALNAVGEICTPFMSRELAPEIIKLLNNPNPYIKKKAALACSKVIRKNPEFLETISDKISNFFDDKNHGVLICGISLAIQILKCDESYVEKYAKHLKSLLRYLRNLSSSNYAPGYDINGITDPFLQVKILEILGYIGKDNTEASEEMNDILANMCTNTDSSKNTGTAVLYELVRTIIKIESSSGLRNLGSNILGKLLGNKDNNYKYIALNTLQEVGKNDINSVQKHKTIILECLKDNDISVKRRALDLIYIIINQSNIKQIVKECLNFLLVSENEFKLELTTKIAQSLEKYSPSLKWQIDTLIKMFSLAGNYLSEETVTNSINLIVNTPELQLYTIHKLFIAIQSNLAQEGLVKFAVYLFGEFGYSLINESVSGQDGESISVSENELLDVLEEIHSKTYSNSSIKEYLLNSLLKLSTKLSNKNRILNLIEKDTTSYHCEVQQRAVEYVVFNKNNNYDLKSEIVKNVPYNGKETNDKKIQEEDDEPSEILLNKDIKRSKNTNMNNDIIGSLNFGVSNSNNTFDPFSQNTQVSSKGNNQTGSIFDIGDILSGKTTDQRSGTSNNNFNLGGIDFTNMNSMNVNQVQKDNNSNNFNNNDNVFNIFGTNSNDNNNNTNKESNTMNFGNLGGLNFDNNSIFGGTTNNTMNSIFDNSINSNNVSENIGKTIFSNSDFRLTSKTSHESNAVFNQTYFVSNLTNKELTNFKLTFLAPKTVSVKVLTTSSTNLSPNQANGIKKEINVTNNDSSKSVVLKLKITYNRNGEEILENLTLNDFS